MITTPNMGLVGWDLGQDPYDHIQLAGNFSTLDLHDHSPGKGVRLGTASYQDLSVTTPRLADNSVNSARIIDQSIQQVDLDPNILRALVPLGLIAPWWRPDTNTPIPPGWAICNGTAWASIANDMGLSTGAIPDLRNRFILGADVTGTGSGTTTPPSIGLTGGSMTSNLTHFHNVNAHAHNVQPHSHTVNAHAHNVSAHSHGMDHKHYFINPISSTAFSQDIRVMHPGSGFYFHMPEGGALNHLYDGGTGFHFSLIDLGTGNPTIANSEVWIQQTSRGYAYNEPSFEQQPVLSTGDTAPGTDAQAPGTNAVGFATDNATATTDSQLATVDLRPRYIGLLYIMKVKY